MRRIRISVDKGGFSEAKSHIYTVGKKLTDYWFWLLTFLKGVFFLLVPRVTKNMTVGEEKKNSKKTNSGKHLKKKKTQKLIR